MAGAGLPAGSAGPPEGEELPPGWLVPHIVPRARLDARAQANAAPGGAAPAPHPEVRFDRQRLKYPVYVPATTTAPASEPYRLWRKRWINYARDELRRGITRVELARELIGNAQGKLSETLLELQDNVVSDEGEPGRPAMGLMAARALYDQRHFETFLHALAIMGCTMALSRTIGLILDGSSTFYTWAVLLYEASAGISAIVWLKFLSRRSATQ